MRSDLTDKTVTQQFEIYQAAGWEYFKSKNFDLAEREISEALKIIDDDPTRYEDAIISYQTLRDIYMERGDEVNATALHNFAKAIYVRNHQVEKTPQQKRIEEIREETAQDLESLNLPTIPPFDRQVTSSKNVEEIYKATSTKLKDFIKDLICEIKNEELGEPPYQAKYAILCFGSLARNEATPYSDLEFGILLEDEHDEVKDYFRKLTKELNIRILNLGETTITIQNIESLKGLKSPTFNGFSFDGGDRAGCKTPLGNLHHVTKDVAKKTAEITAIQNDVTLTTPQKIEKITKLQSEIAEIKAGAFELIMTPKQLAQLHDNDWYKRDRHISTALLTSDFLEGNAPHLEQEYHAATNEILDQEIELDEEQQERRAIALSRGAEIPMPTNRMQRALLLLRESGGRFSSKAGRVASKNNQRSFSPKYDFYRPPVMFVDHLALYFGIEGNSVWERFDKLFVGEAAKLPIAEPEGITNLRWLLDRTAQVRLKNYLSNKTQKEDMLLLDEQLAEYMSEEQKHAVIKQGLGISMNELFEVYYVLLELESRVSDFTEIEQGNEGVFLQGNYRNDNDYTRGYIFNLLLNYSSAEKYYKKAIASEENLEMALDHLALIYKKQDRIGEALAMFQRSYTHKKLTYGEDYIGLADSIDSIANLVVADGQHGAALSLYQQAIDLRRKYLPPSHPSEAPTIDGFAHVYFEAGLYAQALEYYQQTYEINKNALGNNHLDVAFSLGNIANVCAKMGEPKEAIKNYSEALKIIQTLYGEYHPNIVKFLENMALVQNMAGNYKEGEKLLKQSADVARGTFGTDHPQDGMHLYNLGDSYLAQGKYDAAASLFLQSIEKFGNNHNASSPLSGLANIHYKFHRYTDAITCHEQAYDLIEARLGGSHPDLIVPLNNLAVVYFEQGEVELARKQHEKVLDITKSHFGPKHPKVAVSLHGLADVCNKIADYEKALEHCNDGLEIIEEAFDKTHPIYAALLNKRAEIYFNQEKYPAALDDYNDALKIRKVRLGEEHPDYAATLNGLATVQYKQGNQQEASENFLLAYEIFKQNFGEEHTSTIGAKLNYINSSMSAEVAVVYHNTACKFHLNALQLPESDSQHQFLLGQAEGSFNRAMQTGNSASSHAEYANFLVKQNRSEEAIEVLEKIINQLKEDNSGLLYDESEKAALPQELCDLIDESDDQTIFVRPLHFSYFMLIKINLEKGNFSEAQKLKEDFTALVSECAKQITHFQENEEKVKSAQKHLESAERMLSYCEAHLLCFESSATKTEIAQTSQEQHPNSPSPQEARKLAGNINQIIK